MPQMPQYQRPFTVWALKIADIVPPSGFSGSMLVPADATYSPFPVTNDFVQQYQPTAGGYYVLYSNGAATWMSAKDFEPAYTLVQTEPSTDPLV